MEGIYGNKRHNLNISSNIFSMRSMHGIIRPAKEWYLKAAQSADGVK